jgi:D-alanine-D-alanine ligase
VDTAAVPEGDPDFSATPQPAITEYHVIGALRELGHDVAVQGALSDLGELVGAITNRGPEMIFNLTEEFGGDRRLDKNIASLLEMIGVPYTGSGAAGLMLCRDKSLCKQLLGLHKIRVPNFLSIPYGRPVRVSRKLPYPLVVKPAFEDGSEGISNASLVSNEAELKDRVGFVHEAFKQAAIAEEYIAGRELYVSILGNKRLVALPVRECFFDSDRGDGPLLMTYRVKWSPQYREKWNIRFGPSEIAPSTVKNIARTCKKVYRVLQLRDYGRLDLRFAPDGRVVILEANANPDLAYGEEVAESAEKAGISYEQLIDRIVYLAWRRYHGR